MNHEIMQCNDAPASSLSPEIGVKSKHIFTQSPQNTAVVCGIDCLACQDKFFVNNPLDAKENDEHFLDFALYLSL
jgi:hypothetical protein